jgi:hypothetical protein
MVLTLLHIILLQIAHMCLEMRTKEYGPVYFCTCSHSVSWELFVSLKELRAKLLMVRHRCGLKCSRITQAGTHITRSCSVLQLALPRKQSDW